MTVTVKLPRISFPLGSVAIAVTVDSPIGKAVPDSLLMTTFAVPLLSLAITADQVAGAVACPCEAFSIIDEGRLRN